MSKNELMAIELTPAQNAWLAKNNINSDVWGALQSSIYVGANPQSILLAIQYCRARNLDPLKKPVHIVPMEIKDARTGEKAWRDVVMVGINELLATASRTGEFVGKDEPEFGPMVEVFGATVPDWCKVTVWRRVNGERVGFTAMEFFAECAATKDEYKSGQKTGAKTLNYMWGKRPRGQLAKTTLAAALRVAFPVEIGGTYAAEEFGGDGSAANVSAQGARANAAADLNTALGLNPTAPAQSETLVEAEAQAEPTEPETEPAAPSAPDASPVKETEIP
jgi:phage recombination protein Bet